MRIVRRRNSELCVAIRHRFVTDGEGRCEIAFMEIRVNTFGKEVIIEKAQCALITVDRTAESYVDQCDALAASQYMIPTIIKRNLVKVEAFASKTDLSEARDSFQSRKRYERNLEPDQKKKAWKAFSSFGRESEEEADKVNSVVVENVDRTLNGHHRDKSEKHTVRVPENQIYVLKVVKEKKEKDSRSVEKDFGDTQSESYESSADAYARESWDGVDFEEEGFERSADGESLSSEESVDGGDLIPQGSGRLSEEGNYLGSD